MSQTSKAQPPERQPPENQAPGGQVSAGQVSTGQVSTGQIGGAPEADIAALSFEQALEQLERIVGELESGQAPLERSIDIYERGARLKAHCEARLQAARLRVEKIVVGPAAEAVRADPAEFS